MSCPTWRERVLLEDQLYVLERCVQHTCEIYILLNGTEVFSTKASFLSFRAWNIEAPGIDFNEPWTEDIWDRIRHILASGLSLDPDACELKTRGISPREFNPPWNRANIPALAG